MHLFAQSILNQLVIHEVGNKVADENLKLSRKLTDVSDESIKDLLNRYFLAPFKSEEYFHFSHSSDVNLNEMYSFATKIFADPDSFFLQSINIAKHLYEQSAHPNIKSGEMYIAYFTGIQIDDAEVDAIGVFKSENKDTFLKINPIGDSYEIQSEHGININKLDKGCLIFNVESEKGLKLMLVDNTNKGEEAKYWKDLFLNVKPREDSFHHTKAYMKMFNGFVQDTLKTEYELSKPDEIEMLNKTVNYFKKKDTFDFQEFATETIRDPEVIEKFRSYKDQYQTDNEVNVADEFEISTSAAKKQFKDFKSILKLDKNFHVYIHGSRENIVRGKDDATGKNFYQLFFETES